MNYLQDSEDLIPRSNKMIFSELNKSNATVQSKLENQNDLFYSTFVFKTFIHKMACARRNGRSGDSRNLGPYMLQHGLKMHGP